MLATQRKRHTQTEGGRGGGQGGGGQDLTEGQGTKDSLEDGGFVDGGFVEGRGGQRHGGQGGGGGQATEGHGEGGHGTVGVGEAQSASGAVGVSWCTRSGRRRRSSCSFRVL